MLRLVLTDNGSELSDEDGIARLLGEAAGETRLFYCEPRRADQKGGCERNHAELRKLLPKGRGIRLDRLTRADAGLVMSQVNSEPRGKLAWRTPSEMLLAAFGENARALLGAFGVEMLTPSELDLTPGCVERARAEGARRHWPTSPSGTTAREDRRPVALSLEASRGGAAEHAGRTHRDASTRTLHLQERGREAPPGPLTAPLGAKTRHPVKVSR